MLTGWLLRCVTEGTRTMATIKLTRKQRDAIYGEVLLDLTGTGEIYLHMNKEDYEAARRTRRRYEENMRLLDDIGWEPESDAEEFEITMARDDLARALRRLNLNAGATVQTHVVEPIESEFTLRAVLAQTAYGDVFAQLAGVEDEEPAGERSEPR